MTSCLLSKVDPLFEELYCPGVLDNTTLRKEDQLAEKFFPVRVDPERDENKSCFP